MKNAIKKTPFVEFKSHLSGSNESNYTPFVCSCCGRDDKFGKIVCLTCKNEINSAVELQKDLIVTLRSLEQVLCGATKEFADALIIKTAGEMVRTMLAKVNV